MTTKSLKKPSKKGATSAKSAAKKRAKKSDNTASAAPASFRKDDVGRNGLRSFAFHSQDKGAAAFSASAAFA